MELDHLKNSLFIFGVNSKNGVQLKPHPDASVKEFDYQAAHGQEAIENILWLPYGINLRNYLNDGRLRQECFGWYCERR